MRTKKPKHKNVSVNYIKKCNFIDNAFRLISLLRSVFAVCFGILLNGSLHVVV